MNKPLLILFILMSSVTLGQTNLIYNGDFEEYSECPTTVSDPFQSPPEIEKCTGWTHPTYGTSDYFNSCSIGNIVSVPTNTTGEQLAFSGEGYLGAGVANYTGGTGEDGYNGIMWWEYVQGRLTEPMISNHTYRLGMYVSLAEYSDLLIYELGMYLSTDAVSSVNTASLGVTPQVVFTDEDYFNDTVNWIYVEGVYEAQGGEEFITIGNFKNNVDTDTIRRYDLGDSDLNPFVTYFYFDNVSCIDITDSIDNPEPPVDTTDMVIPNVFTPNGDGDNDEWCVSFSLKNYEIDIFNRWGNKIITLDEDNPKWNGKTPSDDPVSDGTYFYVLIHQEDKSKVKQGFVQVIR